MDDIDIDRPNKHQKQGACDQSALRSHEAGELVKEEEEGQ
jgi:hypothetical protein